jgi:hypothetical protein
MANFKSNLPSGWDLNKHYSPVLTNHDKKVRSDKVKQIAAERDEEYYCNLQNGIANRDNTYQAECNARPEVKEKISKALTGKPKTEKHKQALKSTTTNRYGDATYKAAHKAGLAKRDDPFHASDYGIFSSMADAARQVEEKGLLKNAYKKFSKWKTEKPEEYYFIKETK